MGSKWPQFRLDEITKLIVDCPHSTPKWADTGILVLRSYNIRNGVLDLSNPSYTDNQGYLNRIKRAVPSAGDIVLTREAPMGEVCLIPDGLKCCLGQRMVLIRVNEKIITANYLLYILQSSYVQHQISWNEGTGTTVSNIRIPNIKSFKIPTPSLEIQNEITLNLMAIDEKIKINEKINQILEEFSQILFKSWFVDFDPVIDNALDAGKPIPDVFQQRAELRQKMRNSADFKPLPENIRVLFPAEFEETAIGWVPEGWTQTTAGDEFTVKGGSTPSTVNPEFWNDGSIHWTSPKDLTGNDSKVLLDTSKKITEAGLMKISSGLLPVDTVLMSSRAPIGYLALAKVPVAINQGYIAIPSSKNLSSEYTIYWLENVMDDIKSMAGGTTFAEINKSAFKTINLIIPSQKIVEVFTRITKSNFAKIVENNKQTTALTLLRDTLLPKLISGELSLEDLPELTKDTEAA